jgi:hypothetical protein
MVLNHAQLGHNLSTYRKLFDVDADYSLLRVLSSFDNAFLGQFFTFSENKKYIYIFFMYHQNQNPQKSFAK